ncbi:unnamed protein product [Penicillium salamii]|nr:unnamed protein product [Penicillium salamii]
MHHNISSNAYDMYLSMTVTRADGSDKGWTAVGTGPSMTGSLMVIVYGEPLSGESPIVSIRTTNGHHQPKLITKEDAGCADIRLLQTRWEPVQDPLSKSSAYIAKVVLVCYSCHLWPGSPIEATATSHPWIWAWNEDQQFSVFAYDAHLRMHKHHAGNGGWGRFYADMSRSINNARKLPSVPSIQPRVRTLGTSDTPMSLHGAWDAVRSRPMVHSHGILMGLAFLLLFPGGVFMIRVPSSQSFRWHSILQLAASACAFAGGTLGLIMTRGKFASLHQIEGLLILMAVGVQGVLGWAHHLVFLRLKRRTWISHTHIWTGRIILLLGWTNMVSGMAQQGFGMLWMVLVSGIVLGELTGLSLWVWVCNKRKSSVSPPPAEVGYTTFALGEDEDDTCSDAKSDKDEENDPLVTP